MEYILNKYKPEALFHFFEDISAIPRGSGNEKDVADYLVSFAEKNKLDYFRDELNNVIIYKKASVGYESKEPVMLQGHTDMVCEKNEGTEHDFEKDGIQLIEKNGILRANGTTLGGDDGAAVSIMLNALSDETLEHPALECVFTVQEETGLGGASFIDVARLKAKRIINLDTELEGEAVASCAGSMNLTFSLDCERVPFANSGLKIKLKGLKGGHSGTDINAGRANSVKLMGRILNQLYKSEPFNLISITGGNKRNAIPRECEAVISVLDRDKAIENILYSEALIKKELNRDDKAFRITAARCGKTDKMATYKDTSSILSFLSLLPNGVLSMSQSKAGLVESSSNLGVVRTEDGNVKFSVYSRSSVEPIMDYIETTMERLAKVTGLCYSLEDRCPGWQFNSDSRLQKDYLETFKELFGADSNPRVEAIHAGLECGIILDKIGGGDAIAIGPTMHDIHTPGEILDLHSLERTWLLVAALLKK